MAHYTRKRPPDDPGNPSIDFHGEQRANATHLAWKAIEAQGFFEVLLDPDGEPWIFARPPRQPSRQITACSIHDRPASTAVQEASGQEAKLCYLGHLLMENRNGLVVNTRLTQATGRAEREAALAMVSDIPGVRRVTLGADKDYDAREFVHQLRGHRVTPHIAQKPSSAIDQRISRHTGYALSQWRRKRVEEAFGWLKTVAVLRQTRHRGVARVGWMFTFAAAAYNLVRIRNLTAVAT